MNFLMAEIAAPLAEGATLHTEDAMEGTLAVLVWPGPDRRAQAVDMQVCCSLADSDYLDVVRSTSNGLETRLNDAGRQWLADWRSRLAAFEDAAWELYPGECRLALGYQTSLIMPDPPSGWLTRGVYELALGYGMNPDAVLARVEGWHADAD